MAKHVWEGSTSEQSVQTDQEPTLYEDSHACTEEKEEGYQDMDVLVPTAREEFTQVPVSVDSPAPMKKEKEEKVHVSSNSPRKRGQRRSRNVKPVPAEQKMGQEKTTHVPKEVHVSSFVEEPTHTVQHEAARAPQSPLQVVVQKPKTAVAKSVDVHGELKQQAMVHEKREPVEAVNSTAPCKKAAVTKSVAVHGEMKQQSVDVHGEVKQQAMVHEKQEPVAVVNSTAPSRMQQWQSRLPRTVR